MSVFNCNVDFKSLTKELFFRTKRIDKNCLFCIWSDKNNHESKDKNVLLINV